MLAEGVPTPSDRHPSSLPLLRVCVCVCGVAQARIPRSNTKVLIYGHIWDGYSARYWKGL